MGANKHPTTVPGNNGQGNSWSVTLKADGVTYLRAFDVPGPKHVQALNQAWNKVPEYLNENGIDVAPIEVDLKLHGT